jgi:hypothetical protein
MRLIHRIAILWSSVRDNKLLVEELVQARNREQYWKRNYEVLLNEYKYRIRNET